ncbi:MAG: CHAT domain-containing tetratricopeptide repeat protein [Planctomycetota bacterium]
MLSESRELYQSAHDQRGVANCDLDLSELYLRVNLFHEAAAVAQKARAVFASLHLRYEEAKASAHLAAALHQSGEPSKALELFKHAESLFRAEGNAIQVGSVAMCRADLLLERGDTFGACRLIKHSIAVFEGHGATDRLCDAQLRLATALRRQSNSDRAWELAYEACQLIADADRPWLAYRAQHLLAQMLWERGEIDAAEQHIDRALDEIELLWADLKIDEFRVPFLRDKEQVFVDAVRLRLAANRERAQALALRDVERCKSRTIVDMLTRRDAPRPRLREGVDPVLYERYRRLREELDWFLNRVGRRDPHQRPASRLEIEQIAPEVRRRERELAELRTLLKARGPEFSDVHGFATLDPSALQLELKSNEAIVEYFFAGEELLVFVITQRDIRLERASATRTQIEQHLDGMRFQLNKFLYDGDYVSRHQVELRAHASRHLAALFDDLVAPVSRWLGERDLIIVPHGILHYVPFHALVHDGQYLLQRHAISYAPSAHVWMMSEQREPGGGQGVALFGAPDAAAPFIDQELDDVRRLFAAAQVVQGGEATRAALAQLGSSHRILHIAAHAHYRIDSPMFSSIALADGPLTVYDIYNLTLGAELVTLSGCETGVNQVGNGDELLGLMRRLPGYTGTQSLEPAWLGARSLHRPVDAPVL